MNLIVLGVMIKVAQKDRANALNHKAIEIEVLGDRVDDSVKATLSENVQQALEALFVARIDPYHIHAFPSGPHGTPRVSVL